MPFRNEHACRVADPEQFDSVWRDQSKDPNVIIGFREDGTSDTQAFRYPISRWTEARARNHCQEHEGTFEAAEPDAEATSGDTTYVEWQDGPIDTACFSNHMGLWLIEPQWAARAVDAIKAGTWRPVQQEVVRDADGQRLFSVDNGIATIAISGVMMKGVSKFAGTSTARVRRAVREAAQNEDVGGILLVIDSPGGSVDGTADLADDVAAASQRKPVFAFGEDLVASAAMFVASQAARFTATRMTEIGSIGTMAAVVDESRAAELEGVTVHVIATGTFKGAFTPGAPIPLEHLDELQERVADLNSHFLAAVKRGRRLSADQLRAVSDGRVHIAAQAQKLGLIDGIESIDQARASLLREIRRRAREDRARRSRMLHVERAR